MSITIAPSPSLDALTISGAICRSVRVPGASLAIALSDGTLLHACLTAQPGSRFKVANEGAAIIVTNGDHVEVQWPIEWLMVSGTDQALSIERRPEPLPLFPEAA